MNTIAEALQLNKNVIVVATKLQKRKNDMFTDWAESIDAKNIKAAVHEKIGNFIPVLPLKFSTVFDLIFEEEKSIQQLMQVSGLAKYQYQEVANQFDNIYKLIDSYNGK